MRHFTSFRRPYQHFLLINSILLFCMTSVSLGRNNNNLFQTISKHSRGVFQNITKQQQQRRPFHLLFHNNNNDINKLEVTTKHALTGRMCAASRYLESENLASIFEDSSILCQALAGPLGMADPIGEWILVPRTRYGDDFLVKHYLSKLENNKNSTPPCRQLVLLGAGMDTRAFRTFVSTQDAAPGPSNQISLNELIVFEVDQPTTFDVKEKIIQHYSKKCPLAVKDRRILPFDFSKEYSNNEKEKGRSWADELVTKLGFDPTIPTVWLLEGLLYYLSEDEVKQLMKDVGRLSAKGSAVFHDAVSEFTVSVGLAPGGAPFISGNDDYGAMWREYGGFNQTFVRNFDSIKVDRVGRRLEFPTTTDPESEATPEKCRGVSKILFVEAEKI